MSNGHSSKPTTDEFLSIVKKKFDRRKDRVKTLSVDDGRPMPKAGTPEAETTVRSQ